MEKELIIADNPLAKFYLTILRNKSTAPKTFRKCVKNGFILGYEASKYLKWRKTVIETPLAKSEGIEHERPVYIVEVLGASIPMIEGFWDAIPWAGPGLIAVRRKEEADRVEVEVFYERLPSDLSIILYS